MGYKFKARLVKDALNNAPYVLSRSLVSGPIPDEVTSEGLASPAEVFALTIRGKHTFWHL